MNTNEYSCGDGDFDCDRLVTGQQCRSCPERDLPSGRGYWYIVHEKRQLVVQNHPPEDERDIFAGPLSSRNDAEIVLRDRQRQHFFALLSIGFLALVLGLVLVVKGMGQ